MRVYDTFMLFNELDMLECRLTEFEQLSWPVTHVVVESRVTHRGDPKPLHFMEGMSRFDRWITGAWRGRIRYIIADYLPGPGAWERERQQREFCRCGLSDASPDDIILHGDVDEIPSMSALAEAIEGVQDDHRVRSLVMSQHLYAVDWYHPNLEQALTTVIRKEDLSLSFTALRANMGNGIPVFNGGHHFSWIGGHEANLEKLNVHCHLEMTPEEQYWPESGRAYREGRTHGGVWQVPVDDLSDYPVYIRERRCPASWFRPQETPMTDLVQLNLGSGSMPIDGHVNVDVADIPGVDVVWNLDQSPWPFADESAARILAYDIFEHVDKPVEFMHECWRVLKSGGELDLHVSYWRSQNAYTDPTHKRFCTEQTFDYWVPGTHLFDRYGDAYALGKTVRFDRVFMGMDGQELAVVLRKQ